MVRSRIIVTWVGWVTLDYEAEAYERPSAYLLIMTGAGAGGGVGLEAQETRPATARARIAYFIVCIVVFVFALIVAVIATENAGGIPINRSFANVQIVKMRQKLGLVTLEWSLLPAKGIFERARWCQTYPSRVGCFRQRSRFR